MAQVTGTVFDIKRFAVHDGPGIRTTVFLKGCPLRCAWCHSPESQSSRPEVIYTATLCSACGACAAACPLALLQEGPQSLDRAACQACGACAAVCYNGALRLAGYQASVDELLPRLLRDRLLYESSGGGVTLSGGEPAMQPVFASALLHSLRESGINTAVETAGPVHWEALAAVLADTDLVLFDLKHASDQHHARLTGAGNSLIQANLRQLSELAAARGTPGVMVRLPVIPGLNDDDAGLAALGALLSGLPRLDGVQLLPYHDLGVPKYASLGRTYGVTVARSPAAAHMRHIAGLLAGYGLEVSVEG